MGPKKGGKKTKKKDAEPTEPPHDPGWERAMETGKWDRPPETLPDSDMWPTWGNLREKVLMGTKQIIVTWSQSLRDGFPAEIVRLSPPGLTSMELRGAQHLSRLVLSPVTSCPALQHLDLSFCPELLEVLIQSDSLETLILSRCAILSKALIQCKKLKECNLTKCGALASLMLWSDELEELDLSTCEFLSVCQLYCPKLKDPKIPPLRQEAEKEPPVHPPIMASLREMYISEATKAKQKETAVVSSTSEIPRSFNRGF
eukprot:jgi/Mesvir1/14532/Mv05225-RA.1